jgi:hypothetical protein
VQELQDITHVYGAGVSFSIALLGGSGEEEKNIFGVYLF